jgi:ribosomal protein S18 acetylase RimI-like enzyme
MTSTGTSPYRIRAMTQQEVATAIEWAAAEGWNPGLHDAACFYAADPSGFLVGLLEDEPIATISVVRYGTSFGFLGLYIVKPEHRGQGYGLQLWNAGLAYLGQRTIGLDGVVAQQSNYLRSGFELAYRNIRYQGTGGVHVPKDLRIVPLSSIPFDEVNAYDRLFFPADRSVFLKCWICQSQSTAIGILRGGKLSGYGVIRAARVGYKIGPLFADDPDLAEALFNGLAACVPDNDAIYLDTPETNTAAVALAERHGMTVVFETARMYARCAPDLPARRIFGVTTFELG